MPYNNEDVFRMVLENLQTGVCLVDRERRIVFWNDGAEKITGYHRHDVMGHLTRENFLAQCNDRSCLLCGASCPLSAAILGGKQHEIPTQLHHKSGHRVPVHLRVTPIRDSRGTITCVAESFLEDHELSDLDVHRSNLASHGCLDLLTGTPNQTFTQSHLQENLFFFKEHQLSFGILCIQIDRLDELQASHGREAVDVMLHVVAQTMKHTLRPDGFLGRWSENEFLGIVTYCDSGELEKAADNVERMVTCSGVQWWDDLLTVKVSIGRAMVQPQDTLDSLLERARRSLGEKSAMTSGAGAGSSAAGAKG